MTPCYKTILLWQIVHRHVHFPNETKPAMGHQLLTSRCSYPIIITYMRIRKIICNLTSLKVFEVLGLWEKVFEVLRLREKETLHRQWSSRKRQHRMQLSRLICLLSDYQQPWRTTVCNIPTLTPVNKWRNQDMYKMKQKQWHTLTCPCN